MATETSLPVSPPSIPAIVQRYLDGESLTVIAQEHHVHARTIYRWLLTECGPAYEQLVTEALANRIADADMELLTAADNCQVARAREIAKFARMDFERRRPKLYGPKQEVAVDNQVHVHVHRATPQPVVERIPDNRATETVVAQVIDRTSDVRS